MHKIVKHIKRNTVAIIRCIGCGKEVSTSFHYTGKMITGLQFATIKGQHTSPIIGVIETYDRSYVLGGHSIETEKRVAFYKRNHGPVCDECSALCAKTITDKGGNKHQVLILDPRQGFIGTTLATEGGPKPSYKGFNTTITGGR